MNRRVRLRIGRLILRRPAPGGRERIGPAVEAELKRLMAANGLPSHLAGAGRNLRSPNASIEGSERAGSATVGSDIARGVHGQWSGNRGTKK